MNFSVIVAGTAEQPVFWLAQVLNKIAFKRGYNVRFSGSPEARAGKGVMAQVRWGEGTLSPVVPRGDCQLVLGLEPLEAVRTSLSHYTPNMQVVSTEMPTMPASVVHDDAIYPDISSMFRKLEDEGITTKLVQSVPADFNPKQVAIYLLTEVKLGEKLFVEFEEVEAVLKEMGEEDLINSLLSIKKSS